MALVIFNARYISSQDRKLMDNLKSGMRYGATRPGMEEYPTENKNMNDGDFFNYIANRHGAESYEGGHDGLFNQSGKANLEEEEAKLEACPESIEWRTVLSLTKEDAHRVGLYTAQDWQKMLCRTMPKIAAKFNISLKNFVWNAAFHPIDKHGSDHHPHVHIYFYSTDPKEGVAGDDEHTKKILRQCRSVFTNDIFKEDMEPYKVEKTESKEELRDLVKEFVRQAPADLLDGVIKTLPEKGKMEYGSRYMPKETKLEVDKVVRRICSMPGVKEAYEHLREVVRQQSEHYHKDPEDVKAAMQEWEEDFFHPENRNIYEYRVLHNTVLREAANRKRNLESQAIAGQILKEIPKELKAQMLKDISLSEKANEQLPAFQEAFRNLNDSTKRTIIRRLTSDAIFDTGNKIYGILNEDTELADRLIKEVRLDIALGSYEDEFSQIDLLSKESRDDIEYYVKVISDNRRIDYGAIYKLKLRFADIALAKKAAFLVAEHGETLSFQSLQNITQCKRYKLQELPKQGVDECARIAAALSDKNSEIAGSISARQSDKVIKAILNEAYKRELNNRIRQIYTDIHKYREQYLNIAKSENFKCAFTYSELTDEVKSSIDEIANNYLSGTDENAAGQIRNTVCRIASCERIRIIMLSDISISNAVTSATPQLRIFCEAVGIKSYSELPDNKKAEFLNIMQKVFEGNKEISDYIKTEPKEAGNALFSACKAVEYVNEQNRRIAHTANTQILGLVSSALLLFRPNPQQQNQDKDKEQEREQKRKLNKRKQSERYSEAENQSQDENFEY